MPGQVACHTPKLGDVDRGADLRVNLLELTAQLVAQLRKVAVSVEQAVHGARAAAAIGARAC
jgi:hypothetical protein